MQKSMPCEELVGRNFRKRGWQCKRLRRPSEDQEWTLYVAGTAEKSAWLEQSEWGRSDRWITQTVAHWQSVHDRMVLFSWDRKPPRTVLVVWSNPFTQQVEWHKPREVNWSKKKKVKVKSSSRVQLCDPMDCSLPGSSAHGIFQARILEWGAISFSRRSSQPRDWTRVSGNVGRYFIVWAIREATNW